MKSIEQVINSLKDLSNKPDLSNLGNSLGIVLGKYFDLSEEDIEDFIYGFHHGVSLTNDTHYSESLKIYLDDVRDTPKEYNTRTYSVEETINIIKNNKTNITILSLDNDLGEDNLEGYKVLDWLEEDIMGKASIYKPFIIKAHSSNPSAKERMNTVIKRIYKFWETSQ